jgi:hypothetical protein
MFWLIHMVRWFILSQVIAPFITSLTTFAKFLANAGSAKAPRTTTIRIHGEDIRETPGGGTGVLEPPASWTANVTKESRNSTAVGVPPIELRDTREPFYQWARALRRFLLAGLLGHGVSFLLGVMFMVFYREAHTLVKAAAHAAASSSPDFTFQA